MERKKHKENTLLRAAGWSPAKMALGVRHRRRGSRPGESRDKLRPKCLARCEPALRPMLLRGPPWRQYQGVRPYTGMNRLKGQGPVIGLVGCLTVCPDRGGGAKDA